MQRILTVDFDIIMAPSIDIYNDMVPARCWEDLENIPQIQVLTADFVHYQRLTDLLSRLVSKMDNDNIFFIEDHGRIIDYIDLNHDIDLINIDHHHDVGYPKLVDENRYAPYGCANWVNYIYMSGKLYHYTWINNVNSREPVFERENKIIDCIENLIDYDLDMIQIPDKIIICLSEPWIPPMFRPLYFTWLDIMNRLCNTKYEVDFTRCKD